MSAGKILFKILYSAVMLTWCAFGLWQVINGVNHFADEWLPLLNYFAIGLALILLPISIPVLAPIGAYYTLGWDWPLAIAVFAGVELAVFIFYLLPSRGPIEEERPKSEGLL